MTLKTEMKNSGKKVKKSKPIPQKPPQEKPKEITEQKPKEMKELKLNFETDYNLDKTKILDFVTALLKIHEEKQSDDMDDKTGEKRSQLFGAEETPVNLQISGIKVAKENRKHLLKIALPHIPLADNKDVCIFVKDLQKGLKVDHEDSVNHFKDLISSQGVEVSSVIPLRELKVEYKTFEAKTALCHRHEAFLADEKILRFLPKFLGKAFYSRRKFPLPIDLTSKNLSKEVEKALRTVVVPMSNKGTCSMLRIGNTSMKESHLVDNILQATEILAKKYPGGWKNIRSIHLKTETSMSIPIHVSNLSANDVGFVDTTLPQKPKREIITDELSTVLDAKVTVTPNFDVRVEGGQMPDQDLEFDDKEESDSDEETTEAPTKKRKADDDVETKKENKKAKKKGKDDEDSDDEEEKQIEQAENDYLKRNAEQDGEQNEESEEEESDTEEDEDEENNESDEDHEEEDDDDDVLEEASEDEAPPVVTKSIKKTQKGKKNKK